uniref:Uncharacterized protein n=1 Tax=Oryza sativa subsp. japonica TaxID=39947 RepID=Q75KX4_ORYSJ|nr:hypothetical protein [Oryza sativa Japonica Group]
MDPYGAGPTAQAPVARHVSPDELDGADSAPSPSPPPPATAARRGVVGFPGLQGGGPHVPGGVGTVPTDSGSVLHKTGTINAATTGVTTINVAARMHIGSGSIIPEAGIVVVAASEVVGRR